MVAPPGRVDTGPRRPHDHVPHACLHRARSIVASSTASHTPASCSTRAGPVPRRPAHRRGHPVPLSSQHRDRVGAGGPQLAPRPRDRPRPARRPLHPPPTHAEVARLHPGSPSPRSVAVSSLRNIGLCAYWSWHGASRDERRRQIRAWPLLPVATASYLRGRPHRMSGGGFPPSTARTSRPCTPRSKRTESAWRASSPTTTPSPRRGARGRRRFRGPAGEGDPGLRQRAAVAPARRRPRAPAGPVGGRATSRRTWTSSTRRCRPSTYSSTARGRTRWAAARASSRRPTWSTSSPRSTASSLAAPSSPTAGSSTCRTSVRTPTRSRCSKTDARFRAAVHRQAARLDGGARRARRPPRARGARGRRDRPREGASGRDARAGPATRPARPRQPRRRPARRRLRSAAACSSTASAATKQPRRQAAPPAPGARIAVLAGEVQVADAERRPALPQQLTALHALARRDGQRGEVHVEPGLAVVGHEVQAHPGEAPALAGVAEARASRR